MAPTVLQQDGYRVAIMPNDHTPAHVHIKNAERGARIGLDPVRVLTSHGFNDRELSKIAEIVSNHQSELLAEWDKYHPNR